MNSRHEEQLSKPVFARISPKMSRDQIKKNIIDALEKSGITVKEDLDIETNKEGGEK
jgi:hypothetical protein